MEIERIYGKPSRHKYWKILIGWSTWDCVAKIKLYGMSSGKGIVQLGFTSNLHCFAHFVAESRKEALDAEVILLEHYYDNIKKYRDIGISNINRNIDKLTIEYKTKIKRLEKTRSEKIEKAKTHFDDSKLKLLIRKEKLKRVLKE